MNEFEIIKPEIFNNYPINAGITLKNNLLFPPYGFTVGQANIYNEEQTELHLSFLSNLLRIERNNLKLVKQIHSSKIVDAAIITTDTQADGLITNYCNVALCVKLADCAGILLYDPISGCISAVHSGWRGTVQNIVKTSVDNMIQKYNAKPQNILAYVSPCAGKAKYEVEFDVAQYFEGYREQISSEKYLIDIKEKIASQLINSELKIKNIEIDENCTISSNRLHSFRRDKDKSGRMGAFILKY